MKKIIMGLLIFSIVFLIVAIFIDGSNDPKLENPFNNLIDRISGERASPADHIKEDQIHVYGDKVVIEIDNPRWARFTDTNSMDPLIDEDSNAIQIIPESEDQIHVGDIISYESGEGIIIHRVIEIGEDDQGKYYITKGDNTNREDPGKIRFEKIRFITVGIIY